MGKLDCEVGEKFESLKQKENLFKELAFKCLRNRLDFVSSAVINTDLITVEDFDKEGKLINVSEGRVAGWKTEYETPIAALERMHKEVDDYLEIEQMEDEEFITDRPRGVSSDEMKMKEAGHKITDFMGGN